MNPFKTHGAISWSEYMAADVPAALAFFQKLLGWSVSEMPMDDGTMYHLLSAGPVRAAGLMACPDGVPPCWCFYATVDNIEAWNKGHSPNLVVPITETSVGPFAGLLDPQGAYISAIQYHDREHDAALTDIIDAYKRQGLFAWFELHTSDMQSASQYYSKLFGWTVSPMPGAPNPYNYIYIGEAAIGGITSLPAPNVPPHWTGYVTVDDIDAIESNAQALGATITASAFEVPGVGRLMHALDPAGVPLAFAEWAIEDL